jgi:hypothetical protein
MCRRVRGEIAIAPGGGTGVVCLLELARRDLRERKVSKCRGQIGLDDLLIALMRLRRDFSADRVEPETKQEFIADFRRKRWDSIKASGRLATNPPETIGPRSPQRASTLPFVNSISAGFVHAAVNCE